MINAYNDRRLKRAIGSKVTLRNVLYWGYVGIGCLFLFAVVAEALSCVPVVFQVVFLASLPAMPMAYFGLRANRLKEQDFEDLLRELQWRGYAD
ncbi:hypothetical protein [Burkholderia sp. EMB26]|uniref:hypothetical protein n=1 Tax=Burkholderia sp. EMB26 TaxID=2854261 RepID=UPI00215B4C4E|nr:hypothetical protein [Burkholderia sp. EMB26]UVE57647.1 hypothetical protein KU887_19895 [Burkholderia sp. EMB26]